MLTQQLALVDCTKQLSATELSQAAAALQKQATRDLGPIWGVDATVSYFPDISSVPLGYWPIIIVEDIGQPDAGGYHTDKNHQPYSLILAGDGWSLDCSHEMCEMLVDPYGNRTVPGNSLKAGQGRVLYLVECCDPCEAANYAYTIDGIMVSDFYTPQFLAPAVSSGVRYSFNGSINKPMEILPGGYISWIDTADNTMWQLLYLGAKPVIKSLGSASAQLSLRSFVDGQTKNLNKAKQIASFKANKVNQAKLNIHKAVAKNQKSNWKETLGKQGITCVG